MEGWNDGIMGIRTFRRDRGELTKGWEPRFSGSVGEGHQSPPFPKGGFGGILKLA